MTGIRLIVSCVECGGQISLVGYPQLYCSDRCRQILKLVHYGRRVARDDRDDDPLVNEALQIRMAWILAGGYPERDRAVPQDVRATVFARDGGRCQICGQPAAQIDHINGNSADPGNLRALCAACNMAEAQRHLRPVNDEDSRVVEQLMARTLDDDPLFERDDDVRWDKRYRSMKADQRVRMRRAGMKVRG